MNESQEFQVYLIHRFFKVFQNQSIKVTQILVIQRSEISMYIIAKMI